MGLRSTSPPPCTRSRYFSATAPSSQLGALEWPHDESPFVELHYQGGPALLAKGDLRQSEDHRMSTTSQLT